MRVEMISEDSEFRLQMKINEYLKCINEQDIDIIDIKFCYSGNNNLGLRQYTAMIIYKEN